MNYYQKDFGSITRGEVLNLEKNLHRREQKAAMRMENNGEEMMIEKQEGCLKQRLSARSIPDTCRPKKKQ